jgi:MFS family permease
MTEPDRRTGYTFPALIVLGILNHTVVTGSRVTVSLYAIKLGASPLVIGALMGLYAFLPMWLAVSAGRLSDRIGVRRPMLLGSCGIALGAVIPCILPGLPSLYATTSLIGLSFMLFQVAAQNATGFFGGPADRPRNFGLLAMGYSISGLCGPLIAGFMIDHASFTTTFAVLSFFPVLPIVVFARGALALPGPQRDRARGAPSRIIEMFRNRRLRRVFIVNGLLSMSWDLHTFFIPIYGASIGLSASRIGMILAAFAAATFVVRVAMPWIARNFTEIQVLSAALFLAALAYCMFPLVSEWGLLMLISFTLGLALGSGQPMVMSLLHSLAPAGRMGEAVGLRMSIVNASTFAVPLLFGAVGASFGIAPVFWTVGAFLAGGGVFARRR